MEAILSRERWGKNLLMEDRDTFNQHSLWHGCWELGDAKSQGISSHGIDMVPQIILILTHITGNPVKAITQDFPRWNYLSIPKLQPWNSWSLEMDK